MFDVIFAIAIASVFLGLAIFRNRPVGLLVIVFLIPLAEIYIRGKGFQFSWISVAVIAYFLGRLAVGKLNFKKLSALPCRNHLSILVAYLCISLLLFSPENIPRGIRHFGAIYENVSAYFSATAAAILLWILIQTEVDSEHMMASCMRAFLWSGIYLAVVYLITGVAEIRLPDMLSPRWISKDLANELGTRGTSFTPSLFAGSHFTGFIGFTENFAEYLFVLFAFAVTLLLARLQKKTDIALGASAIVISLLLSIPTAIKAYPVMIMLFLIPLVLIGAKGNRRLYIIVTLLFAAIVYYGVRETLSQTLYFKRFSVVTERLNKAEKDPSAVASLARIMGREDIVTFFPKVAETGGIFGIGPVIVRAISYSPIPYHNLYYSLWLSFGLMGLVIYIAFFLRMVLRLIWVRRLSYDLKSSAAALVLIMLVLLIEQFKVSAFRVSYGVISFWLVFGLSSACANIIIHKDNRDNSSQVMASIPDVEVLRFDERDSECISST